MTRSDWNGTRRFARMCWNATCEGGGRRWSVQQRRERRGALNTRLGRGRQWVCGQWMRHCSSCTARGLPCRPRMAHPRSAGSQGFLAVLASRVALKPRLVWVDGALRAGRGARGQE